MLARSGVTTWRGMEAKPGVGPRVAGPATSNSPMQRRWKPSSAGEPSGGMHTPGNVTGPTVSWAGSTAGVAALTSGMGVTLRQAWRRVHQRETLSWGVSIAWPGMEGPTVWSTAGTGTGVAVTDGAARIMTARKVRIGKVVRMGETVPPESVTVI